MKIDPSIFLHLKYSFTQINIYLKCFTVVFWDFTPLYRANNLVLSLDTIYYNLQFAWKDFIYKWGSGGCHSWGRRWSLFPEHLISPFLGSTCLHNLARVWIMRMNADSGLRHYLVSSRITVVMLENFIIVYSLFYSSNFNLSPFSLLLILL